MLYETLERLECCSGCGCPKAECRLARTGEGNVVCCGNCDHTSLAEEARQMTEDVKNLRAITDNMTRAPICCSRDHDAEGSCDLHTAGIMQIDGRYAEGILSRITR